MAARDGERERYNPLKPDHWYTLAREWKKTDEAQPILQHYSGNLPNAVVHLFPELRLELRKFYSPEEWQKQEKRIVFFEKAAQQRGFDPHHPDHWYSVKFSDLSSLPGAAEIKYHYKGDIARGLVDVFPDISFDLSRFSKMPRDGFEKRKYRKKALEQFASSLNYHPQSPADWYNLYKSNQFKDNKEITKVLAYYDGSLAKALVDLFPHLSLDKSKLMRVPKNYWQSKTNKRKVLVDFAKENKFDPRQADNWYSVQPDQIKDVSGILSQYNGSFSTALVDLFPEINFDISKFAALPRNFWQDAQNKRRVFEEYATKNGFDPLVPTNWYTIRADQLQMAGIKGTRTIMTQYKQNIAEALADLFPHIGLDVSKFPIAPKEARKIQ